MVLNKIIFKDARITQPQESQPEQIKKIFPEISPVKNGDIVAIKIHPGEYGNTTHVRPVIIRTVVDLVIKEGGIPFVTDTTTLYKGMKLNAAELIQGAAMNGFTHIQLVEINNLNGQNVSKEIADCIGFHNFNDSNGPRKPIREKGLNDSTVSGQKTDGPGR